MNQDCIREGMRSRAPQSDIMQIPYNVVHTVGQVHSLCTIVYMCSGQGKLETKKWCFRVLASTIENVGTWCAAAGEGYLHVHVHSAMLTQSKEKRKVISTKHKLDTVCFAKQTLNTTVRVNFW